MEQQHATSLGNFQARTQTRAHARAKRAVLMIDMENFFRSRSKALKRTNSGVYNQNSLHEDLKILKEWIQLKLGVRPMSERAYADFRSRDLHWTVRELMTSGIEPIQVFTVSGKKKAPDLRDKNNTADLRARTNASGQAGEKNPAGLPEEKTDENKNAVDLRIAMDAACAVLGPIPADCVILIAGDSDYVPVLLQLRGLGTEVRVIGLRGNTSGHLAYLASEFKYFDTLEGEIKNRVTENVRLEKQFPPSVTYYKTFLEGFKPRFKLIPQLNWHYITKQIYDEMIQHQPVTPNELREDIQDDPEIGEEFARAVIGQLMNSECLKLEAVPSGTAVSKQRHPWDRKVCLAAGVNGPESMETRTREKILSELKSRLQDVGDTRELDPKVIAEMFFGPSYSQTDLEAARKFIKATKASKKPQSQQPPAAKSSAA